jgi:SM-20-related protein
MIDAEQTLGAPTLSIAPPHCVVRDFLPAETVAALLDFAQDHEAEFEPTGVGEAAALDPTIRVSHGLRRIRPFRPLLTERLLQAAPALIAGLRVSPFEVSRVELQLVAHGDGAFYAPHIDLEIGGHAEHLRVLSGVYYFHREPKAFSGGALRLHAIADESCFIDIEPVHNTLLAFPAWAPHQVRPVSVPSGAFIDARFAINCWLWRRR